MIGWVVVAACVALLTVLVSLLERAHRALHRLDGLQDKRVLTPLRERVMQDRRQRTGR